MYLKEIWRYPVSPWPAHWSEHHNASGWGLAAFGCFHLAPSLGLPPLPPGAPISDLQSRQL